VFKDLLIRRLIPQEYVKLFLEPRIYVWLVHPRDTKDTTKKVPFLKNLPEKTLLSISKHFPPFIISNVFNEKNNLRGYVIAIPLIPKQIKSDNRLAVKKTRQALILAKKLGAQYISLGGFLPSIVYNSDLDKEFSFKFYDGINLLSKLALERIDRLIRASEFSTQPISFGIIGATTKIGQLVTNFLAQQNYGKIYAFGKTPENLEQLKKECLIKNKGVAIQVSTDLSQLQKCNFVILTAYLEKGQEVTKYLQKRSVFFSVIEPVSPFVFELKEKRKDIKIIKGISITTPGISYSSYVGLPSGRSFACVTEAMILINNKEADKFISSKNPKESIKITKGLLKKYKFKVS
jgi:predicted amino acid dehydrogenase